MSKERLEQSSDFGSQKQPSRLNAAELYASLPQTMNPGQKHPDQSGSMRSESGSLQMTDPYRGAEPESNSKFDHQHPWRADVLKTDDHLRAEIKHDGGHLGGHYRQLMDDIKNIRHLEQADARKDDGHLTSKELHQLQKDERQLNQDIKHDFSGKAHGHPGSHRHHGDVGSSLPGNAGVAGATYGDAGVGGANANGSSSAAGSGDGIISGAPNSNGSTGSTDAIPPSSVAPGSDTSAQTGTPLTQNGHALLGSWILPSTVGAGSDSQALSNFDSKLGRNLGIQDFYTNENLNGKVDIAGITEAAKQGTTPMLSLRTTNYQDVISGKDDAYLKQVASQLKNVPGNVLLRPNWEMDGNKNQQYGTPQQYIAAWQHIHDIFTQQGATNTKFVWCPNTFQFKADGSGKPDAYYPGNKYVDYIGADGYSGIFGQKYQTPDQIFDGAYNFATQNGKPFMIGETGVNSNFGPSTDAQYISQMGQWVANHADTKGVVWFSSGQNNLMSNSAEWQAFQKLASLPEFSGS